MNSHWLRGLLFVLALCLGIAAFALVIPDWVYTRYLDPIGILLGIFLAIPVFWTAYQVTWGERAERRRRFREISESPGRHPTMLIVDLLPQRDTRHQVENFRRQHEELKNIPEDRIITIHRSKHLTPEDMPDLQVEIRNAAADLMQHGTDRIHVFIAAPIAAAAMVGAEFANMPAVVYQYQNGEYVNFSILRLQ